MAGPPTNRRSSTTSVVGRTRGDGNLHFQSATQEISPHPIELYTADQLSTPAGVARALERIQQNARRATASARSLPQLGGVYWPNVQIPSGATISVAHGLGVVVSFGVFSIRQTVAGSVPAVLTEVGQSADHNTISIQTTTACTVDLWIFPRPVAVAGAPTTTGINSFLPPPGGGGLPPAPPNYVTPVSSLAPGQDGQILFTGQASGVAPITLTSLVLWLRGDTVTLDGSGNVSQWTDLSGLGHHAVQATAANRPIWVASDRPFNSQPALRFDGNRWLAIASFVQAQPLTIYLVAESGNAVAYVLSDYSHSGLLLISTGAQWQPNVSQFSGNMGNVGNALLPTALAVTLDGANGNNKVYVNDPNSVAGSDATNLTNGESALVIGALSTAGPPNALQGDIVEVLVFSGAHTAAQRASVMQYFGARYGLPIVGTALVAEWLYCSGDVVFSHTAAGQATVVALQATPISATPPTAGGVLLYSGSQWNGVTISGDVSLAANGLSTVVGLQTHPVVIATPQLGDVLTYIVGFSPPLIANLKVWLRGDVVVLDGSNRVITWTDQSGNGNSPTQATAAQRPAYVGSDAAYNNKPTLTFTSSLSEFLQVAFTQAQPCTVYVVGHATGGAPQPMLVADGSHVDIRGQGGVYGFASTPAGFVATSTALGTTPHVFAAVFNSGADALYLDNATASAATNTGTDGFVNTLTIGAYVSGYGYMDGKLAEVLVYAGAHNGAQIAQVMGYLGARYGITVTGGTAPVPTGWTPLPVDLSGTATALANTLSVAHGGTGDATLTAHAVLLGEGSGPVASVGPGAIYLPLIGQGSLADPIFQVLSPQGGGTGGSALTAHAAVTVNPTASALAFVAPGAANNYLRSNGTDWASATLQSGLAVANPWLEATGSGAITTTATVFASITLTVAPGQTARLWASGALLSSDTNTNIVEMDINSSALGRQGLFNVGSVGADATMSGMLSDTTVGTNTYNLKFQAQMALGVGGISLVNCVLRGTVTN